ncbi:MAG: hypothetical protein JNM38_19255 [Acidobacteria bacterium]|nr:hypothetical protein [Acidobacteriota bacterium]
MDGQPTSLRPAFERMLDPGHELSDAEVLAAYVDGSLDADRRERLELALADDAVLRAEVQGLREVRAEMQADGTLRAEGPAQVLPFAPRLAPASPPKWAMAAILVVGLGLGLTGYRFLDSTADPVTVAGGDPVVAPAPPQAAAPPSSAGTRQPESPDAGTPGDAGSAPTSMPATPATALALRDGRGTFNIDATGAPSGVAATVDPVVVAMVTDGAETGALPLPSAFGRVQSRAGRLMGGGGHDTARPTPVAPRSTYVRDGRPVFTWEAIPEATAYRVVVVDEALDVVAESGELREARWTPTASLPRGRVLTWQVTATSAAGSVTAPQPPASEARFQVISPSAADTLVADLARCGDSRLARAFVLARSGLVADAVLLFEDIAAQNPDDPHARRWLRAARASLGR